MSELSFKPAWWLPGPHLQTLWPALCRKREKSLSLRRERFELPDGDFLDLDWVGSVGPIVMILHGLEGSINSSYATGMLRAIVDSGWRGVFVHFRGCSGEPNRLSRSYHSGETNDLAVLVETLINREPEVMIAAVGFSLGGNVLLKWLGETGQTNPLIAAIAISVPFEINKTVKRVQSGFSRVYQWHLLKCLRKRLTEKFTLQTSPLKLLSFEHLKTIWDFDEHVTAPLHGFAGADEYYSISSCRQYLKNIQVPTLLLQAKDDPFMTKDLLPEPHELSAHVKLEMTSSGGHVGFVSGKFPWRIEYWLEQRVPAFFKGYI